MYCCIECFQDTHIRAIIEKQNILGNCDFCCSLNVGVCDTSIDHSPIQEKMIELLQVYSVSDNHDGKLLNQSLNDDWDIFNLDPKSIGKLLECLGIQRYFSNDGLFKDRVIITSLYNPDFLNDFCVVRCSSWKNFAESIKYANRFHNEMFNSDALASFLSVVTEVIPLGTRFYRARIASSSTGFKKREMGAPPKEKGSVGRINPEGITILYLASDDITVLHEVRASTYDYVTVATFENTRDIIVVNLSRISKISPFLYDGALEKFAVNRKVLNEMAAEVAKPLRRNDSTLEYLPTQYVSEFIKREKYDGVEYSSTFREKGFNLACYNESIFSCTSVKTIEITNVTYDSKKVGY